MKALKIILWIILAVGLLITGCLLATVKLLKPERLTPIVETVANKMLNADVSVERVQLSVQHSFPFLTLEVDSLSIISRDIAQLPAAVRDTLPCWADTLCAVERFKGGINLIQAVRGNIFLNDLKVCGLSANALIVNDSLTNFNIYESVPDTIAEPNAEMPDIRINRFSIIQPKPLRYADLSSGMELIAHIDTASVEAEDGNALAYRLDVETNVTSPLLDMLHGQSLLASMDGTIDWKHTVPNELGLNDFTFSANALRGKFSTLLDFSDQLMIKSLDAELGPVSVMEAIAMIPDSVATTYGIPQGIDTDACLTLGFSLHRPYDMASTDLPYGLATISLPNSYLKWKEVDIKQMELNTDILLRGANIDSAIVNINKLVIGGPATTIEAKMKLEDLLSDPRFDGKINGKILLGKLPAQITALLGGATVKGTITMDASILGRQSMLSRNGFHLLKINGGINAQGLRYNSPAAQSSLFANHASLNFGTSTSIKTPQGTIDSLLTMSVTIDTARMIDADLDICLKDFKIGAGAINSANKRDTTAIIPFGGRMQAGIISLFSLADSAGMRVRDLKGSIAMQRYQGDSHLPLFRLNAELRRASAGDHTTRLMISNAMLNAKMYKLPESEMSRSRVAFNRVADSLHRAMPGVHPDSIYNLAMEIRRKQMAGRNRGRRIHTQLATDSMETIDWGANNGIKHLLLDWSLSGSMSAKKARLFTTAFPLRNRISNLNLHFNNDSIVLDGIQYKAGKSDFVAYGNISNMKRALTSRSRQSLKVDFDLVSDTIDVNEIAKAFFMGAAASGTLKGDLDDENSLEINNSASSDSIGPLLIPVNVEATLKLKADNVLYSDFLLHNLSGEILAYDGALNLHDLHAASNVGSINLSALYSAPTSNDMKFGFGMKLKDFNIHNFLQLVPAVDSIMPLMHDMEGIIKADIAATADIDKQMNLIIPTLHAAISLEGDSLVLLDPETFKTISKWLLFKDKKNNLIGHMSVQLIVENNTMQLYPFVFDFDRYRLGVQGRNDLDMNFDYHVAVLKSPIPFKFGINVKGNTDKYKIRLGRARFNEKKAVEEVALVDTTRINLINQFENVFRRGVRNSRFAQININERPAAVDLDLHTDTLSSADSLYFRQQGILE